MGVQCASFSNVKMKFPLMRLSWRMSAAWGGVVMKFRGLVVGLLLALTGVSHAAKVTVDDLMKLRFIADVSISPDGQHVAYVLSAPSIERAEHVAILYLM